MTEANLEASLAPRATFGRYRIIKRLAVGGMAELFLAHPINGEEIVVLKKILPQYLSQPDFVDMFLDEARIASTLDHPNVVSILDVGTVGNDYFFVMEFVLGCDLRTFLAASLRAGQLPPLAVTIHIIASIAAALGYAHAKRDLSGQPLELVHRDITPDNIFVSYDGVAKLGDFGIAKAAGRLNQTRGGQIKGKVMYMSPEQCIGTPLDRRSDIFSLGIILYEMTTGHRLFDGDNDFFILKKIVEKPIRKPTDLARDYPLSLERIVLTALAYQRDHRYATGQDFADALAHFAAESNYVPTPDRTRTFVRWVFKDDLARHDAIAAAARSPIEIADKFVNMVDAYDSDGLLPMPESDDAAEEVATRRAAALRAIEAARPVQKSPPKPAVLPIVVDEPERPVLPALPISAKYPIVAAPFRDDDDDDAPTGSRRAPRRRLPAMGIGLGVVATLLGSWLLMRPTTTIPAKPPGESTPQKPAPLPLPTTPTPIITPLPIPVPTPTPPPDKPRVVKTSPVKTAPVVTEPPRAPGKLVLVSTPWVEVTIDGKPRGQTPLSIELPSGPHSVVLRNKERAITRTLDVTITPGETLKKKLEFE